MTEIRELDINKVKPNCCLVYEESAILHLSNDIRVNGLKEPIVVEMVEYCFQIVDGEKRWRACKRIGLEKIKAVITEESLP